MQAAGDEFLYFVTGSLSEEQSLLVVNNPKADTIQPPPAAYTCVRGISQIVEENQRLPLEAKRLDCDLVSKSPEGTCNGSIVPFDSRAGQSEDVCIKAVEKTIRRPRIQPRAQFHAVIAVNQADRDKYSRGTFLVLKPRVEIERDQSIHPPVNGSCSSGETKIIKGEDIPLARTSS